LLLFGLPWLLLAEVRVNWPALLLLALSPHLALLVQLGLSRVREFDADLKAAALTATEGYHSKSWDDLPVTPDIVITVCANAAGETCPVYLGPVLRAHWGVDDPARAPGQKPVSSQAARAYLRGILRKAGIEKQISPHKLRHTYATNLLNAGAERVDIQALLGHVNLATTRIHSHVDQDRRAAAVAQYVYSARFG